MPPNDPGRRALDHIDRALANRPEPDKHELSAALRCLGALRDGLVAARRAGATEAHQASLDHVNAIISSVMAVQYPLGEIRWEELEKSRAWLARIADREGSEI